jgi:hypothetical protein
LNRHLLLEDPVLDFDHVVARRERAFGRAGTTIG